LQKLNDNSRFIGYTYEQLGSVDSTNDRLWALAGDGIPEGYAVSADFQVNGRGQTAASWFSDEGENILCSIYLQPAFLPATAHFHLNMAMSLGVADFCQTYLQEGIWVKWPNDIYFHEKKLAGILIENSIQGNRITETVVGIGININQGYFPAQLPNPISFLNITGRYYKISDLLIMLFAAIEKRYIQLREGQNNRLTADYLDQLLGKDHLRRFQYQGRELYATIRGVDQDGRLILDGPEGRLIMNHKEIYFYTA
jgi:BirA family biotin operon repressor/biotin-[acetyl-CoA-carboxylase] ligase